MGINHFHYEFEFKTNEPIQEQGQRGGAVEFLYTFSSQLPILRSQTLRSSMAQASLYAGGVVGLVKVTSDHSGWKGCPTMQGRQAECQPAIATHVEIHVAVSPAF